MSVIVQLGWIGLELEGPAGDEIMLPSADSWEVFKRSLEDRLIYIGDFTWSRRNRQTFVEFQILLLDKKRYSNAVSDLLHLIQDKARQHISWETIPSEN